MSVQVPINPSDYVPTFLDFSPLRLTDEQFERLCRNQPDLCLEMSADGKLIIVAPTVPDDGWRIANLIFQVGSWTRHDKTGVAFDSSTLFTFPNEAKRSPDTSWVRRGKWDSLSELERSKFSRLVPEFVAELRRLSDSLETLGEKMLEYILNGVQLGWLIDPQEQKVHIYRANGEVEILNNPETVSGEDVLKGFELKVREIW